MEQEMEDPVDQAIRAIQLEKRVPIVALKAAREEMEELQQVQRQAEREIIGRYRDLMKPYLERAAQLIGGSDPRPEQLADINDYLKPGQEQPPLKGHHFHNYWNRALKNFSLSQFINQKDEQALQYLLHILIIKVDPTNITLKFVFKPNPFFQQTTIVRSIIYKDSQPFCMKGNMLTPKPGFWLTHQCKKVTKNNGEIKQTRGRKISSFFDIFLNLKDNPKKLEECDQIMKSLQILVRDSLNYYLGVYKPEEEDGHSREASDDAGQENQDRVIKGIKKNKKF